MNLSVSARTEVLPLDQSKKLLDLILKRGKQHTFEAAGCEGGAEVEIETEGISNEELRKTDIPKSSYLVHFSSFGHPALMSDIPKSLLRYYFGGPDYPLHFPRWLSELRVYLVPKKLGWPISFGYKVDWLKGRTTRKHDLYHELSVAGHMTYFDHLFTEHITLEKKPDDLAIATAIENIWDRFNLPTASTEGTRDDHNFHTSRSLYFDPNLSQWGWPEFEEMVRELADESDVKLFHITSLAEAWNSTDEGVDGFVTLTQLIADTSPYECLDFSYNALMPMSWKDREKLRKKWKKPELQELGTISFGKGAKAEVKIIIQKEGYEFILDFSNVKGVEAFTKTTLHGKAAWTIGE